jgi:uncharacterized protein
MHYSKLRLRPVEQVARALVFAIAIVLTGLALSCGGESATSTTVPTGASAGTSRSVSFATQDGVTLTGYLFGSGTSGVILAHMYPADQTSWYPTAEQLAREGYLVLTFDFRGYGESQGAKQIEHLDLDVVAAIREMASKGATRVVLVGASMGGTACLIAADASQVFSQISVAGVVTLSAPVEFKGLSAEEATPRILAPLLFVAAENDAGAKGAMDLQKLAANKGDLQIVPGSDHGTDLLTGSQAGKVLGLLLQFLRRNLPAT